MVFCAYGSNAEKLEITGNLVNRNSYFDLRGDSVFNPGNILDIPQLGSNLKLELFLDSKVNEIARAHIAGRLYYSTIKFEKEYRSYFDEGYIDLNFNNHLLLRVGKQRIVWGTGMAWNPSDILNPVKDPLDPLEQKQGALSLNADIPLGDGWEIMQNPSFTAVFVPKVSGADVLDTNCAQIALKIYFLMGSFDINFISSFIETKKPIWGLALAGVLFDELELHGEAVFQNGTERHYVNDALEIIQKNVRDESVYSKWLIGSRYTLPENIVLLVEYLHLDEGYNNAEMHIYLNFVNNNGYISDLLPQINLRKNYLFATITKSDLWDAFNISLRKLMNIDDYSLFLSVRFEYTGIENTRIAIEPCLLSGSHESEFGNMPYRYFIRLEFSHYF